MDYPLFKIDNFDLVGESQLIEKDLAPTIQIAIFYTQFSEVF
jgi:hypothetical protein